MERYALGVKGMSCNGCEQRLEQALTRLEGIARASADHTSERVEVVADPTRVSEADVRSCIEGAGFEVVRA
ncbi:MAG: heavy-metal-associated domain-containing protein [Nitriliruptorales bacterium]